MRLIFVTQYDPLDLAAGGPVNKVRALSSHLAGRGHSVTIISSRAGVTTITTYLICMKRSQGLLLLDYGRFVGTVPLA